MTSPDDKPEHAEALHERFATTAARVGEREERAREALRDKLRLFLELSGEERVLDAGAGTGGFAFAVSPLVREVVAVDLVTELLEEGRHRAGPFPNVTFVQGDVRALDLEDGSFDLAGTVRTLHHVTQPGLLVAELTRVTRFGGRVLIVDQIAPVDPLAAVELDRFERARDPSYTRTLPDTDVRAFLEANGLVLQRSTFEREQRDLEQYLDLAACEGEPRKEAVELALGGLVVTIGWYLAVKPVPAA